MATDKLNMIDDLELKLSKYETVWLYHALLNMNSADIAMAVPTYPALLAAGIARDLRGRLSLYIKGITINTEYEVVDEPDGLIDPNHRQNSLCVTDDTLDDKPNGDK